MKIFARPSHQLGNAMRSTVTMKIFADYIGAEFYVDGTCVDKLDHLKDRVIMKTLFNKYIIYHQSYNIIDENEIFNFKSWGTTSDLIVEGSFKFIPDYDFAVNHIYAMKPFNMTDETYYKNKINIYKSLSWPDFLIDQVELFKSTYLLDNIVGIHIRYTDNLQDNNKKNTRLEVFIDKIKSLNNRILLCSDNQDVINQISNLIPDVILPNKIENPLFQSLYEMMLLSNTKYIIGSYASTFSYEAALFKGTDIELFINNNWIKYCLM